DRAGCAQEQDLRDSVDRRELWRAVAAAVLRTDPARLTGREVVGGERTGHGDDHDVVDHQRRARDAPFRDLPASVGCGIARPHGHAAGRVESVQYSGRAHCVDATLSECRCATRTGAAVRFIEAYGAAVPPRRLARAYSVTR